MVRVKRISPPQLGHQCFELRLFQPMVEIVKSNTDRAVMAVTVAEISSGSAFSKLLGL